MPYRSRPALARYAIAVGCVALATIARRLLDPVVGPGNVLFITAYPAVVAAVWWGGRNAGLAATLLSVIATALVVVAPVGAWPTDAAFWSGALLFAALGVVVTMLIESTRAAQREADHQADAARVQEEWLRVMLTSIGDGVIATDGNGRVTLLNVVARELTGWGDDAIGMPLEGIFRIVNETSRAPVETPVARVMALGRIVGLANHTILINRDGSERPIEDSAAPIRDARNVIIGVVLVFRDASAQRRAEAAERRVTERLELALAAGGLGVWEWDFRTDAVWWSDAVAGIHGMEPGQFGGTLQDFQALVHADDQARVGALIAQSIADRSSYVVQFRTVTPGGEQRWIGGHGMVFCDNEGTPIRMVGVSRDITDQRTTEDALREADQRKDEFLATLAHELRNPLAPIRNAIEVTRLIDVAPVEPVRKARDTMERQVRHMTRLLDDLLDVSRITRGRLDLRREPVLLTTILQSAIEASERLLHADERTFATELPPGEIWLDADHTRLAQVFANLLNNAAKFTRAGGRISVAASVDDGVARVRVRDDGIGIAEGDLRRMFELFAQGDTSGSGSSDGLGIGLTIARRLVEMHGGTLTATSAGPGSGSEFLVTLPVGTPPAAASAARAAVSLCGNTLRVLVADDNVDATDTLAMLLKLWGHDVETASDGHGALSRAATFRPEVVLLDIGMPGLDGYEVAQQLREDPALGAIKIVAITGWGQDHDKARASAAGFDAHLTKPVDPAHLEQLLGTLARG